MPGDVPEDRRGYEQRYDGSRQAARHIGHRSIAQRRQTAPPIAHATYSELSKEAPPEGLEAPWGERGPEAPDPPPPCDGAAAFVGVGSDFGWGADSGAGALADGDSDADSLPEVSPVVSDWADASRAGSELGAG